jgi:DNA-binding NarL/FixJ family response regulator
LLAHRCMIVMEETQMKETRMQTIRAFVVDDHPVVREMICSLLSQEPALQVVCQTADGEEAVEKADELRPDLVVLDIGLAGITGIEAARRIRKVSPESKIIFLSQFDSLHMASEVLRVGGQGFVQNRCWIRSSEGCSHLCEGVRFVSQRIVDRGWKQGGTEGRFTVAAESEKGPGFTRPIL